VNLRQPRLDALKRSSFADEAFELLLELSDAALSIRKLTSERKVARACRVESADFVVDLVVGVRDLVAEVFDDLLKFSDLHQVGGDGLVGVGTGASE
jgi:hypothetical protein